MKSDKYSMEEVTERLGVTPRTLHYYEEIGLIRKVPRTEGGHRCYDEETVSQLEHIIKLKNLLGISLQEIRSILDAEKALNQLKVTYDQEESGPEKDRLLDRAAQILQTQVQLIDEKMSKLNRMKEHFEQRLLRAQNKKRIKVEIAGDKKS